jgi:UDP-glucose 4-epimerase
MRLLVTGGAGYVGSHACICLLEAGHEVVVIDDFSNSDSSVLDTVRALIRGHLEWFRVDIRDRHAVADVMAARTYDAVLHFAALKSAPQSVEEPAKYWDVNVGGMAVVVQAALQAGIPKFVFSSSASLYGTQALGPIAETAVPRPANPYARTKLVGEQLLLDVAARHRHFQACSLRYFNPIGAHGSGLVGESPRQEPSNLFPVLLRACQRGTIVEIYGRTYPTHDGTAIRDYIHVMDVAEGHVAALEFLDGAAAEAPANAPAFNLGTGVGTSVLELIHRVETVFATPIVTRDCPPRAGDLAVSLADPTRTIAALGWQAKRSIDDACRDAKKWLETVR